MLKHSYNHGNETLPPTWECNSYMQYFCSEVFFPTI